MQGETARNPQAVAPPSEATRAPAPQAPQPQRQARQPYPYPQHQAPTQAMPRVVGPRAPTGPGQPPFPLPAIPPLPQQQEGAAAPAASGEPIPSFAPLLSRAPRAGALAASPSSTVPPPLSKSVVRVALLLPLSGPNAELGKAMLDAAQMALFDFANNSLELLVNDTKGTPQGAHAAATVAIGDGAQMILGPLLSSSVRAVGPVARAANVPVVAFTSDRAVAGDGIYTLGFLPSAEIWRIVAFARSQGITRFAALAPDNAYGETVVDAMKEAVAASGATLARVQYYDPAGEDFTDPVRQLANYGERRSALLEQRKALEGRDDEISRRALKRLERLQTIGELPFDALMVADGGKRLQSIAALLPFYDIDPDKVRMLGTGQWDEPGIGAEPALVGGWFAAPPPSARVDFEANFMNQYGRTPPRLATLAYDAAALAAVLARNEKGADFSAQQITAASGFWGRDGIFRFMPEGVAQRGLAVMRVTRRGAEIISRAPETFQAKIN